MSDYSLGISFSLWDIFDAAKVPSCEVLQEVMNKFAKFQSYEKSISCFCCCCNVKSSVTQSQQCKCGGDPKIFCVWCVYYTYHGCMHACLLLHFADQMNILSTLTCFFAFCHVLCVANQTKDFLDLGRGGQGCLMSFSACLEPQRSLRFCPLLCCCFCIYIYCLKKSDIYKSDGWVGTCLVSKI